MGEKVRMGYGEEGEGDENKVWGGGEGKDGVWGGGGCGGGG